MSNLNKIVRITFKILYSPLGIAAIVLIGGIVINTATPIRPSGIQKIYGGAEESAPELTANLLEAALAATAPLDDEIDYVAADDLFYSTALSPENAGLSGSGSGLA